MKKDVVICGAGFSAEFDYPLMNKLLEDVSTKIKTGEKNRVFMTRKKASQFDKAIADLEAQFNGSNYSNVDIEELLSKIDIRIKLEEQVSKPRDQHRDTYMRLRNEIFIKLADIFYEKDSKSLGGAPSVKTLTARFLKKKNIISMNWDRLFESKFKRNEYIHRLSSDRDSDFVKLHGSYNLFPLNFAPVKRERIEFSDRDFAFLATKAEFEACKKKTSEYLKTNQRYKDGLGFTPYIMYPAVNKNYQLFIDRWFFARRLLNQANRWYIIGYAFPKHDLHIKVLLRSAFSHKLKCNPKRDHPDYPQCEPLKEVIVVNPDISNSKIRSTVIDAINANMDLKYKFVEKKYGDFLKDLYRKK